MVPLSTLRVEDLPDTALLDEFASLVARRVRCEAQLTRIAATVRAERPELRELLDDELLAVAPDPYDQVAALWHAELERSNAREELMRAELIYRLHAVRSGFGCAEANGRPCEVCAAHRRLR
jgi:hypothetical protein